MQQIIWGKPWLTVIIFSIGPAAFLTGYVSGIMADSTNPMVGYFSPLRSIVGWSPLNEVGVSIATVVIFLAAAVIHFGTVPLAFLVYGAFSSGAHVAWFTKTAGASWLDGFPGYAINGTLDYLYLSLILLLTVRFVIAIIRPQAGDVWKSVSRCYKDILVLVPLILAMILTSFLVKDRIAMPYAKQKAAEVLAAQPLTYELTDSAGQWSIWLPDNWESDKKTYYKDTSSVSLYICQAKGFPLFIYVEQIGGTGELPSEEEIERGMEEIANRLTGEADGYAIMQPGQKVMFSGHQAVRTKVEVVNSAQPENKWRRITYSFMTEKEPSDSIFFYGLVSTVPIEWDELSEPLLEKIIASFELHE